MKTEIISRTAELYKSQVIPKVKTTEEVAKSKETDKVEISKEAKAALEKSKEVPEGSTAYDVERADKVKNIKDRVANSVYRLDPQSLEELASKLLKIV